MGVKGWKRHYLFADDEEVLLQVLYWEGRSKTLNASNHC